MQSKRMIRLVDDDIESPYKIVQKDIFDFFYKVVRVFVSLS